MSYLLANASSMYTDFSTATYDERESSPVTCFALRIEIIHVYSDENALFNTCFQHRIQQ